MRRCLLLLTLLLAGCAGRLGHPAVQASDSSVTFDLVSPASAPDRWYVHLDMGELGRHTWFVDTGYSRTTCDDDFVELLGLTGSGRTLVRGESGKLHAQKVRLPPFSLGPHRVEALSCVVRDLDSTSSVRDLPEGPTAGVIGADLLRRFYVVLDGGRGELTLGPPGFEPLPKGEPSVIRLYRERRVGRRFQIETELHDTRMRFLLDTGANRTLLSRPSFAPDGERVVRITATGGSATRTVRTYRLPSFSLGAAPIPSGVHAFSRPTERGRQSLLGLDVLGSLRIELDASQRRARLLPTEGPGPTVWVHQERQTSDSDEDQPSSASSRSTVR